jgi:MoCo/4Fe-4S cofactor protein with predicted Tat translocation signal
MEKTYWKGIEEKEQLEGFREVANKEFREELPILGAITEPISTGKSNRRDFLKMLGFSVTAAAVAASCDMPVRKSIPYVWRPEEIVPGVANYYASSMWQGGDYCSLLVKTREGRPIKVEGNKLSSITKGGTSARAQASVLSLYDGSRFRNAKKGNENITWDKADAEIGEKLKAIAAAGGKTVLFSSTVVSPSTKSIIADFITSVPGAEHLTYDAVSYSGILDANEKTFGKRSIPAYNFGKAKVILSVGADFLGTWISPVEFSADYSANRKVSKDKAEMSRHIQIESMPTITGYKADTRISVKPSEELSSLVDLLNVVTGTGSAKNAKVAKAAEELKAAGAGNALVVCGSNDFDAQVIVNAINNALGSYGSTITWDRPYNTKQGSDKSVVQLAEGLNNGSVKAVLFLDSNPAYSSPVKGLAEAIKKAELSVSFANRADETALLCQYVCPDNHWLESWNDLEPKAGVFNTVQPTISKLFDTRPVQETLLKWSGKSGSYYDFIQKYWENNIYGKQTKYSGFWAFWDNAVHDGEIVTASQAAIPSFDASAVSSSVSELSAYISTLGDTQVRLYESVAIGDGSWGDNPFLQELPDSVSKVAWGNFIAVNPRWYVKNGYNIDPDFKEKRYALGKLTVGGESIELPVVGVPGTPEGTFGVALGYGRTSPNHSDLKVGANAFKLLSKDGNTFNNISKASIVKTESTDLVAITQTHFNITLQDLGGVKTRKTVKETTLKEYAKNPAAGNEDRAHIMEEMVTLYYEHTKPGHHWTMVIDLNSCDGCGACVVACNVENNVPVVGKDQVIRAREMHWLRIDRYYTGEADNPDVVFQPMLCQHCDNAPCENVCPVAATNHSSEGINQMAYNRCIGTRYCANNCPYKVRRFNWYDYQQADAFDKKYGTSNDQNVASEYLGLHEPLTRMVLNPDVTVRSRGVMEKCSFCAQRLQAAKLEAKKDGRLLADGDATVACQTACASGAIVFGDRNDKTSEVAKLFNDKRTFGVIEEIHTMPNVLYQTQVRNRDEVKKYDIIDYYHES